MPYQPINKIFSRIVALPISNVDTDQIIPARFLKATDKEGFGEKLFYDWRYKSDGSLNPDFVLNQPGTKGKILLAGANFGCGSSREHAAWALYGYGFQVVISSGFADIFKSNAMNNGILPIEVDPDTLGYIFTYATSFPDAEWTINLQDQQIILPDPPSQSFAYRLSPIAFPLDPFRKECMVNGLDFIDYLVNLKPEIAAFEKKRQTIGGAPLWSTE